MATVESASVRKNFSHFEKEILLELTQKYVHIVENKKTNMITVKQKNDTWKTIETEFNGIPGVTLRTMKQLWDCYKNLKKKATKERANQKIEIYKTGGGSVSMEKKDTFGEKLLSMGAIIEPLENVCDSDSQYITAGKYYTKISIVISAVICVLYYKLYN